MQQPFDANTPIIIKTTLLGINIALQGLDQMPHGQVKGLDAEWRAQVDAQLNPPATPPGGANDGQGNDNQDA